MEPFIVKGPARRTGGGRDAAARSTLGSCRAGGCQPRLPEIAEAPGVSRLRLRDHVEESSGGRSRATDRRSRLQPASRLQHEREQHRTGPGPRAAQAPGLVLRDGRQRPSRSSSPFPKGGTSRSSLPAAPRCRKCPAECCAAAEGDQPIPVPSRRFRWVLPIAGGLLLVVLGGLVERCSLRVRHSFQRIRATGTTMYFTSRCWALWAATARTR